MRFVNKFLIIFTLVFGLLTVGAWRFIQSKYVSTLLTEYINKNVIIDSNMSLSFTRVSGGFFPPRTILEDVNFKVRDELEVQVKDVSAAFSLLSLFSSNIRFNSVEFSDGYVVLEKLEKSEDDNSQVSIFNTLSNVTNQLPFKINKIEIKNSDFYIAENKLNIPIKYLALSPFEYSYDILLDIENVKWEGAVVDNLYLDAEIVENNIRVRNGYIFIKDSKISGSGKYEFSSKKVHSDIDYKINFDSFEDIKRKYNINIDGVIEGKSTITGAVDKKDIYVSGFTNGSNIHSDYVNLDSFKTKHSFHNNKLTIRNFTGEVNSGKVKVADELVLNFNSDKVIDNDVVVETTNLHLNDILYFLGEDFVLLKGRANGKVLLRMNNSGEVLVDTFKNSPISITNLTLRPSSDNIINFSNISLENLNIVAGRDFNISVNAKTNNSLLNGKGSVIGNLVDFDIKAKNFSISDLGGEIAGVAKGHGDFDISIKGTDNVVIDVNSSDVEYVDVFGFLLEKKSKANLKYSINENIIYVDSLNNTTNGQSNIYGVVNLEKENVDLNIKMKSVDLSLLHRNIKPIWEDVKVYTTPLEGVFNADVNLSGNFSNLVTKLKIDSDKVSAYKEPIDNISLELIVSNREVEVKNAIIKKNRSSASADFVYNFKNGFEKISFITTPIKLSDLYRYRDLGLGYNGYFSASIDAKRNGVLKGKGNAYLTETKIGNQEIGASELEFEFIDKIINFNTNILNQGIHIDGELDFSKSQPKVILNYAVDMPDIKPSLAFISEHNSFNNELNGFVQMSGQLSYDFNPDKPVSSIMNLTQFHISNYGRSLTLRRPTSIEIEQSEIKQLGLSLSGSGGYYQLSGSGNVDTNFQLVQELDINLSYLTLLTSEIERILGSIKGKGIIVGNRKKYDLSHSLSTSNFGLKLKSVPLEISNANGVGAYRDQKILINNLSGEIGSGDFNLSGYIKANFPFPEVYITSNYTNVGYQVESRSIVNTDGNLTLSGRGFPYLIKGSVFVNGGLIENEFNDFKSSSEFNKSLSKYITQNQRGIPDLINLDIDLSVKETVRLRNRLADLLIAGDLHIDGQFTNPAMQGQLIIVPGLSKFKFRGNDFILSEGVVYFTKEENMDPITLNLLANSTIGQYDIEMGITGSVDDISINLESTPSLSRDNIFSLLTLGVTSDFSQNLEDSQRTNLTTIGIGTFLVDQLNINEGLDAALGLKLSVLPEFTESSDSPIEEATKSEQSVKTATKLQITKKVNDNINLKFSNTFDSESNKQSINVDYSISDKLSIEGIFESEDDTNNKEGTDGSVGADIKYKWSF
ncbi:translocation/assembly module TamB domain-containing protein [Halobacteriovorax sp. XZX-3]|uniref:translocation/assembly module TamB domain-containing protein n=1 Tax=unclassified Halobacteriovorax TaxID=2639665 RepID=UPI00371CEBF6